MEELIKKLQALADKKTWTDNDNFSACDYAGGNYDDAYWGGCRDGEIELARELLDMVKNLR